MIEAITIPDIGENVVSGTVVAVHVKVGDTLAVDDTVIELETDKAVVEIPSPFNGSVTEVLAEEGAEMKVGEVIARVETGARTADASPKEPAETPAAATETPAPSAPAAPPPEDAPMPPAAPPVAPAADEERPLVAASPSIRRLARELGVEIHVIQGSGPGGRITEADIKTHVRMGRGAGPAAPGTGEPDLPDFTRWGEVSVAELETVRRLTARSTATSWHAVPHVTQFDNADITHLNEFIDNNGKSVAKAGGKLTLTAVLAKVCAAALKKFRRFNASIDLKREQLIYKNYVHIAIAVDTPRGLLMPVIRDADQKDITALAVEIVDLAGRARDKKVRPDELEGGTFSISNQGGIGGVAFTPIVLWPQVAILGMSRSALEPRYVDGELQPRHILPLSLSYDHRVIDGADAARFMRWICACLEQPMGLLL